MHFCENLDSSLFDYCFSHLLSRESTLILATLLHGENLCKNGPRIFAEIMTLISMQGHLSLLNDALHTVGMLQVSYLQQRYAQYTISHDTHLI